MIPPLRPIIQNPIPLLARTASSVPFTPPKTIFSAAEPTGFRRRIHYTAGSGKVTPSRFPSGSYRFPFLSAAFVLTMSVAAARFSKKSAEPDATERYPEAQKVISRNYIFSDHDMLIVSHRPCPMSSLKLIIDCIDSDNIEELKREIYLLHMHGYTLPDKDRINLLRYSSKYAAKETSDFLDRLFSILSESEDLGLTKGSDIPSPIRQSTTFEEKFNEDHAIISLSSQGDIDGLKAFLDNPELSRSGVRFHLIAATKAAIEGGHFEIVKYFVEEWGVSPTDIVYKMKPCDYNPNLIFFETGPSLLTIAARTTPNPINILDYLLSKCGDLNYVEPSGGIIQERIKAVIQHASHQLNIFESYNGFSVRPSEALLFTAISNNDQNLVRYLMSKPILNVACNRFLFSLDSSFRDIYGIKLTKEMCFTIYTELYEKDYFGLIRMICYVQNEFYCMCTREALHNESAAGVRALVNRCNPGMYGFVINSEFMRSLEIVHREIYRK